MVGVLTSAFLDQVDTAAPAPITWHLVMNALPRVSKRTGTNNLRHVFDGTRLCQIPFEMKTIAMKKLIAPQHYEKVNMIS